MENLEGVKVVITGGSRGLGLGMVEALVARKARVTVVGRTAASLERVAQRLSVSVVRGDATDAALARSVLADIKPNILILNAGVMPETGLIHEQSWEGFTRTWDNDVKAGFHWVQYALTVPLPAGSRVLLTSSGAALGGSPLSGGYAGAKRMLWWMAQYANVSATELGLGISFQTILPQQMIGETELGGAAAEAYAKRKGVTREQFLAGFGRAMSASQVGEHVASILTDPRYAAGVAFGLKGDTGITSLDA